VSDIATGKADPPAAASERAPARPRLAGRRWLSPLTARILLINLMAPLMLAGGLVYLDQYRSALVDARIEAMFIQGELIAGALGESALAAGQPAPALDARLATLIVRRTVAVTGTRARLFDDAGRLIADSRFLPGRSVAQRALPPHPTPSPPGFSQRLYDRVLNWLPSSGHLPLYEERPVPRVDDFPEAVQALGGEAASYVRSAGDSGMIISVAVPVQGLRKVLGALMLTADSGPIDDLLRDERLRVFKLFSLVLVITIAVSLFLAGTIARPVRRLAEAADKVRLAMGRPVALPDFSRRQDEIGDLSAALKDMTDALYRRLNSIESFAADVAHEIKNPLTSLRSAVETLAKTHDPEKQRRLGAIIADDVERLDRLISDISRASRLDAELARLELEPVDVALLLATLVQVYRDTARPGSPRFALDVSDEGPLMAMGDAERLGQVARNLLDNAVSFSPPGGTVRVTAGRGRDWVWFTVDDEGPGIPEGKLEAIFDRFYSERPAGEAFGKHSGLGLSISRQIVERFGGLVEAENRIGAEGRIVGARLRVRLPA
jgi:two-component system, OmpR family, sensor histidine kinase ChvG